MAKLWKQHAAGSGEMDSPTLSHMALLSSPLCKCIQIKTGPRWQNYGQGSLSLLNVTENRVSCHPHAACLKS